MFSDQYDESIKQELRKCLRVMPHHQNTSGFFITIIEKVKELGPEQDCPAQESAEKTGVIQQLGKGKKFAFLRVDPKDPDIEYIKAYYGLPGDFPMDQLICQNQEMKKIYYISKSLSDYLYTNVDQSLNIINIGVLLFQRNQTKHGTSECIFRILQDGVQNIGPAMTKRIVKSSSMTVLK
jgi:hypothetical protein